MGEVDQTCGAEYEREPDGGHRQEQTELDPIDRQLEHPAKGDVGATRSPATLTDDQLEDHSGETARLDICLSPYFISIGEARSFGDRGRVDLDFVDPGNVQWDLRNTLGVGYFASQLSPALVEKSDSDPFHRFSLIGLGVIGEDPCSHSLLTFLGHADGWEQPQSGCGSQQEQERDRGSEVP